MSRSAGFRRHQLWLISNEGFSEEAVKVLESKRAYCSSRRQLELLFERFGAQISSVAAPPEAEDEFLIVVPMGQDNELVAANTVEQIARRLNFRPDALNQIRTAIAEASMLRSTASAQIEKYISVFASKMID